MVKNSETGYKQKPATGFAIAGDIQAGADGRRRRNESPDSFLPSTSRRNGTSNRWALANHASLKRVLYFWFWRVKLFRLRP
jgi:hypothetical protein